MTTNEKIKKIRQEKRLTQKQLGELCGIAESTIRRYELGDLNPKLETIRKIAKALDVSISDIVDDWKGFPIEEIKADFIGVEEEKYNKELNKRGIQQIYDLLTDLYSDGKYRFNLNDIDGLNVFLNINLDEYKNVSNKELKELEKDILKYLDFQFEKILSNKETNKFKK
ncbi:MAG: helix-turn-helix transcriptional regulator [Coprobacillus sp.]|nr:helix-turn-helix transcriptional regulator [Coprobacillus sp.]